SLSLASWLSVAESNSKKTLTLRSACIALSSSACPWALASWEGSVLGASATEADFSSAFAAAASGVGLALEQATRPAASESGIRWSVSFLKRMGVLLEVTRCEHCAGPIYASALFDIF